MSLTDSYILITGGAGYIGSHTNALLNTLDSKTIVLDNLIYGHKESLNFSFLNLPIDSVKQSNKRGGGGKTLVQVIQPTQYIFQHSKISNKIMQ
ncbi:hypothetical protein CQA66_06265 [Helicobacter aurati]|uniref:NAD-dependent epimerase/dehydratase domain-containing protein n=1 Tax=Helicobacter aurati TaxID=137778 RepID=A0A3D8J452_9HELI|nr:NAD-dependent epimerase/dehydratase family protein [Helicobacter aurati]RDU71561.1 hypothetical protein CQA66_06265 [Helicobacter aurati]